MLSKRFINRFLLLAAWVFSSSVHSAIDITPTGGVFINLPQNPLLPSPGNITLNATDNVGIQQTGTLTVNNGSVFFAGTLFTTFDPGPATLLLTGNGSRITLRRPDNGRGGLLGNGTWQILDGGVFDAGDPTSCTATCNMTIGNFRGATSTMLVSGAGSRFQSIDFLGIGFNNSFLGSPNADVNATVNVTNGGRIDSEDLVVGVGVLDDLTGTLFARGTTNVQGTGSLWNAGTLTTAAGLRSIATVNVADGGVMNVTGLSALTTGNGTTNLNVTGIGSRFTTGAMNVAVGGDATVQVNTGAELAVNGQLSVGLSTVAGADGVLNIDGAGSRVSVGGDLTIGTNIPGSGAVNVTNGADLRVTGVTAGGLPGTHIAVGLLGGSGTLIVDASTVTLDDPASSTLARLHVGADGGTGTVRITNGSVVRILKQNISPIGDGVVIGRNFGGNRGVGTITVDNATLISSSPRQFVDIGVNDDLGTFVADSAGTLNIVNQGLVRIDGQTGITRLRMARGAGSVAAITVDTGRLELIGNDVAAFIGHDLFNATGNGQATLDILNGGTVLVRGATTATTDVIVGFGSGNGAINVGNNSRLDIEGDLTISLASARQNIQTGTVTINAGGIINTNLTQVGNRGILQGTGRLNARRLRVLQGGVVDLTDLTGIDEVSLETGGTFARAELPFGRANNQTLSVLGGTRLDIGNGIAFGTAAGSRANVTISGVGSQLRSAGGLALGSGGTAASTLRIAQGALGFIEGGTTVAQGSTLTVAGATSRYQTLANMNISGSVLLENDAVLEAGSVQVLNGGLIGGSGTVRTTGPGNPGVVVGSGAVLAPGNSPGTLNVNGNVTLAAGGRFLFEIEGRQAGQFDVLNVTGDIDLQGGTFELQLLNGFQPTGSDSFDLITATGATNISPGVVFVANGLGPDFEFVFRQVGNLSIGSLGFTAIDIQQLAGLSPNQTSMAIYMDDLCPRIEALATPNAAQADLDIICGNLRSGNNTAAEVASGLDALMPDEILGIVDTLLRFTTIQHGNLSQRLNGLRNGAARVNVTGLDLITENIHVASADLQNVVERLLGGAAGSDDFARWGFFSDGNFHYGDQGEGLHETGFDFETVNITMGVDYRLRDNLFLGVAGGYNEINADFDTGGGMLMKAGTMSLMGTWFRGESLYVDALATYGWAEADTSRLIQYTDVGGKVDRRATGSVDGTEFVATLGSGWDMSRDKWIYGPHAGAHYSEIRLEELDERGARGASLKLREQVSRSLTANVGGHVSYTFTPSWGVWVPHARIDYVREFHHEGQQETVRFAADFFQFDPLKPTVGARLETDEAEKSYFVWSVGAHAQFVRGFAAFVNYRGHLGLGNLDVSEVTVGVRYEKTF